jgi:hypothetical protein
MSAIVGNVLVYGSVALVRTKLVNKNEPEEIPKEFPSREEPSN